MTNTGQAPDSGSPVGLRNWLHDHTLIRLIRNSAALFSGNMGASILGLVSMSLTARALGSSDFGILVLIQAYVTLVGELLDFKSPHALIRYGAEALELRRSDDFRQLVKFGILVDAAMAVVSTIVACGTIYLVGSWRAWEPELVLMGMIFSLVLLFRLSGTPTAVLRLFDRFGLFASVQMVGAVIKVIGVTVVFMVDGGLWGFLLVWAATDVSSGLLLLAVGGRELRRQGFSGWFSRPLAGVSHSHPGIWGFLITTNLNSSIRATTKELDTLIVGAMLDPAGAGVYRIAARFARIVPMTARPLQEAIYPDLARIWAAAKVDEFARIIVRLGLLAGFASVAALLGFVAFGPFLIAVTVGSEYAAAYPVLLVYIFAHVIFMFGIAFRPAMFSMALHKRVLVVYLISVAGFFVALPLGISHSGIVGAASAHVVFNVLWFIGMATSIHRQGFWQWLRPVEGLSR